MNNVYPVIVVPGITATYLRDHYLIPPETVWSVLTRKFENIALHPDNYVYEAIEPARVLPDQIFEIAYEEMINELRYNLRSTEDNPVPVYPFGYDWRQSIEDIEIQLEAFINEVLDRTKLMRRYHNDWFLNQPKVNLVGHSMGGLIIAGYLEKYGNLKKINKVVSIATPFKGSFEAIVKIATGTANLGSKAPGSREREAARIIPSLYQLLPSCDGIEQPSGGPGDIFNPNLWQPSIIATLQEYVRLHSVLTGDFHVQALIIFNELLQKARKHRQRIDNLDIRIAGLTCDDWLCIAGVNADTRVGVRIEKDAEGLFFNFTSNDRKDNWESDSIEEKLLTGDGTVPLKAALPAFLDKTNLICLSPDDFGYWELQDKALAKIAGFHGVIPNMNVIHRLIVRHFTGKPDAYKNTWGRSFPGVSAETWKPPFDLFHKK